MEQQQNNRVTTSIQKIQEKVKPGCNFVLIVSATFNLAMLVIGYLNIDQCPVNKNIPLFLIATGAIGIISKLLSFIRSKTQRVFVRYIELGVYCVEMVLFFLGTYWVYTEFKPNFDSSNAKNYCNKTAYLFAFIYITVYYAMILAILLGFCCYIGCAIFLLKQEPRAEDSEAPALASSDQ